MAGNHLSVFARLTGAQTRRHSSQRQRSSREHSQAEQNSDERERNAPSRCSNRRSKSKRRVLTTAPVETAETPCIRPCRKDIELSPSGLPLSRLLPPKAQRLCSPVPEMQSSRVVSLRLRPLRPASRFIPPTRDHCLACGIPSRSISGPETRVPAIPPDAATPRGRLCFRRKLPQHRLRVCRSRGDRRRRPRNALRLFRPMLPLGSRTRRCGCADHHGEAQSTDWSAIPSSTMKGPPGIVASLSIYIWN